MRKLISLILVILLVIPFVHSLDLTLNSNEVGEDQNFDGSLEIKLEDPIEASTPLYFYINDELAYQTTLKEAISGLGATITKESFKDEGESASAVDYTFKKGGRLINAALKFDGYANAIKFANNLSFKIKGIDNPDNVAIDINNNDIIDYTFKGDLINQYEDLDDSNLDGKTTPESFASIKAESLSSYCVQTIVKPSSSYVLKTIARKGTGWNAGITLSGTISDTPLAQPSCGLDDNECCVFSQPSDAGSEISCNLSKTFDAEKKAYICLFVFNGNMDELPFEIGYFKDSSVGKSYINGKLTDKNFFIYGKRQLFNTILNKEVLIEKEYLDLKKIFSTSSYLVPIAITSTSAGTVRLSDIKFQYETDVPITLSSFELLEYTPEQVVYDGTLSISLIKLTNLTAGTISEGNELYVSFDGEESNTEEFDVIEGAEIFIQKTTSDAYLGQNIEFLVNTPGLISYSWNFGDNATATGQKVSHMYSNPGTYTITVQVKNDMNISSQVSTTVNVANLRDSVIFLVDDTKSRLDSISSKVESSTNKEILGYLDIPNQIQSMSANLTLINNSVIAALNATNASSSDSKLALVKTQLDDIRSKLIKDFTVSTITFTPKASDLSQIPTATTLGREEEQFQEKVLKAQENVQVSGTVYVLTLTYLNSESKQTLVKKTVSGEGKYYEFVSSLQIKPITKTNYKVLLPGLYEITGSPFVYSLDGDATDSALGTATVVVPTDLSSINVGSSSPITIKNVCGDGFCESSETSTCPEDCTAKKPWWVIIVLILVLAGGLAAIYFFKDKLFVQRSKAVSTKIFANERDYQNIKKYVESSVKRGFTDMQIDLALKKQGWKPEQISFILSEVREQVKKEKQVKK